jgi:hypothetical protein
VADACWTTKPGPSPAPPLSATWADVHCESLIDPVWPAAVADASVKLTVPKSAKGSGWQSLV